MRPKTKTKTEQVRMSDDGSDEDIRSCVLMKGARLQPTAVAYTPVYTSENRAKNVSRIVNYELR